MSGAVVHVHVHVHVHVLVLVIVLVIVLVAVVVLGAATIGVVTGLARSGDHDAGRLASRLTGYRATTNLHSSRTPKGYSVGRMSLR